MPRRFVLARAAPLVAAIAAFDDCNVKRAFSDYDRRAAIEADSALFASDNGQLAADRPTAFASVLDGFLRQVAGGARSLHVLAAFFAIECINASLAKDASAQDHEQDRSAEIFVGAGTALEFALSTFIDSVEASLGQGELMIAVAHAVQDMMEGHLVALATLDRELSDPPRIAAL